MEGGVANARRASGREEVARGGGVASSSSADINGVRALSVLGRGRETARRVRGSK